MNILKYLITFMIASTLHAFDVSIINSTTKNIQIRCTYCTVDKAILKPDQKISVGLPARIALNDDPNEYIFIACSDLLDLGVLQCHASGSKRIKAICNFDGNNPQCIINEK